MASLRSPAKWLFIAIIAIILLGLFGLTANRIPPGAKTEGDMWVVKRRVLFFGAESGRPPHSLKELPDQTDYSNKIHDEWGRPIEFTVDAGNIATLTSLGKDGLPGGDGENADIIRRFAVCLNKDCADEFGPWLQPNN